MRKLSTLETKNLELLTEKSIRIALIEPTLNGLKKSIMDATLPIRNYLKLYGIHDYDKQPQGDKYKKILDAKLVTSDIIFFTQASLYRPVTKQGDPRIWFSGLKEITDANDILGLVIHNNYIHVFNLSKLKVEALLNSNRNNPIKELVKEINISE